MSALYRLQQGLRALFAFAYPVDEARAQAILSPRQMALFQQLSRSEKLHSLNVLQTLHDQAEGEVPHILQVSALLHDIGKIRYPLAIWQKTLAVLVRKIAPHWERRYSAADEGTFWQMPFIVRRHHPRWGADMLQHIADDPCLIWLVAHHADPPDQHQQHPCHHLLIRLQAADNAN